MADGPQYEVGNDLCKNRINAGTVSVLVRWYSFCIGTVVLFLYWYGGSVFVLTRWFCFFTDTLVLFLY